MKKLPLYSNILRIMAVVVHPLWLLAIILAVSALPFARTGDNLISTFTVVFFTVLSVIFGLLGFSANHLLEGIGRNSRAGSIKNLIRRFLWLLIMLLSIGVCLLLALPMLHSAYISTLFITCIIAYIAGSKQYYKQYDCILGYAWITMGVIFLTLLCAVLDLLNLNPPIDIVAVTMLVQLSTFLLIKGQANIDYMMQRRKHRFEHLPSNIRHYVFLLTSAVIAVLSATLIFRDDVAAAFNYILALLYRAINYIASLFPASQEQEQLHSDEVSAVNGAMPPANENPYSEIIDVITFIILSAIIAILIYKNRHRILSALYTLFLKIAELFARLLRPTPISKLLRSPESSYYIDKENRLTPVSLHNSRKKMVTIKEWKRLYSKFLKMPNSRGSYRQGYKLTLLWLTIRRAEFSDADTPLEILENVKLILPQQEWGEITEYYNRIRYNENEDLSVNELKKLISCMDKNLY